MSRDVRPNSALQGTQKGHNGPFVYRPAELSSWEHTSVCGGHRRPRKVPFRAPSGRTPPRKGALAPARRNSAAGSTLLRVRRAPPASKGPFMARPAELRLKRHLQVPSGGTHGWELPSGSGGHRRPPKGALAPVRPNSASKGQLVARPAELNAQRRQPLQGAPGAPCTAAGGRQRKAASRGAKGPEWPFCAVRRNPV